MSRLYAHHDADGVTSAVLYTLAHGENRELVFPDIFGAWKDGDGSGDVMVDMRPTPHTFRGMVIDHHPNHPPTKSYKLIFDDAPTSVVMWRYFGSTLPPSHLWKVAVGAVGDGQANTIPSQVWESNRELLLGKVYTNERYGELKTSIYPVYTLLSSLINSPCRLGECNLAYESLWKAKSPLNLLYDEKLGLARDKCKAEHKRALEGCETIDCGAVVACVYTSKARLSGWIASELFDTTRKTAVVINKNTLSLSVRGDLAMLVSEKAALKSIDIAGHAGFMGGHLESDTDIEKLIEIAQEI